jgi:hypothetical protein
MSAPLSLHTYAVGDLRGADEAEIDGTVRRVEVQTRVRKCAGPVVPYELTWTRLTEGWPRR